MARTFQFSPQIYLRQTIASPIPSGSFPFSASIWFYFTGAFSDANDDNIFQIQDASEGANNFRLSKTTADPAALTFSGGAPTTTNTFLENTWHHGLVVVASSTDRKVWLDADDANKGTNTGIYNPSGIDSMDIGREGDSSPADAWSGFLAECAIWGAVLDATDAAVLFAGFSPLMVKRQDLRHYYRITGQTALELDLVGDLNMTAVGAGAAAPHPRIIYPHRHQTFITPAAVGAANPKGPLGMPLHGPFAGPVAA